MRMVLFLLCMYFSVLIMVVVLFSGWFFGMLLLSMLFGFRYSGIIVMLKGICWLYR